MKKNIIITIIALSSLTLQSCASNKEGAGTAIGAISGALIGSQFGKGSGQLLGVALGAAAGGLIGNSIGQSLDKRDKELLSKSYQSGLENAKSGEVVTWRNPDSGNGGSMSVTKTYKEGKRYCREYTQTIEVGGKKEQGYGTACRQPDGSWEIIK